MRRTVPGAIALAAFAVLFVAADAHADTTANDPWDSTDKFIHYGASAGIAASGYAVGALLFDTRAHALAVGAGAAAFAGISKELLDLDGAGNASWKDMAWNGLGMVTGLAVAWGIDLLIRGVSAEHPPFARTRGGIAF